MKKPVGSELRTDSKPVHRFLRGDGLEPRYGETMCSFWQWRIIAQHLRAGEVNFENRARFQNTSRTGSGALRKAARTSQNDSGAWNANTTMLGNVSVRPATKWM